MISAGDPSPISSLIGKSCDGHFKGIFWYATVCSAPELHKMALNALQYKHPGATNDRSTQHVNQKPEGE